MKNITDFKSFKRLNEAGEHDARAGNYGGAGDTYFANVKGNFAGAENTLVGSAVMKIFGFFKRKINEGILFLYKKALFREYLANVLRYAVKNGITAGDSDTLYEVQRIKDEKGEEIAQKTTIKVKFVNEKKELMTTYIEGSKVINEQNTAVDDGTYQKQDYKSEGFEVKDGLITRIITFDIPEQVQASGGTETVQSGGTETTDSTETKKEDYADVSKELKGLWAEIYKIITNPEQISDEKQLKLLGDKKAVITALKKDIQDNGIGDINKALKLPKLEQGKKDELNIALKIYQDELSYLTQIEKYINDAISKASTSISNKSIQQKKIEQDAIAKKAKEDAEKAKGTTVNPPEKEGEKEGEGQMAQVESLNFNEGETLNEKIISKGVSFRGVKLFGVDKKLADEVGNLDMGVLEDESFAKKFESDAMKDAVTKLVIENQNPIIKIQLAAERMFAVDAKSPATMKLENTWRRMIADDKALFSRYMYTDKVDPYVLSKSPEGQAVAKGISDGSQKNEMGNNVKKLSDDYKGKENTIIKWKNDGKFSPTTFTFGVMNSRWGHLVFLQQKATIEGRLNWIYKILGFITDENWAKLVDVKDNSEVAQYITYDFNEIIAKLGIKNEVTYLVGQPTQIVGVYNSCYIINDSRHLQIGSDGRYPNDHINFIIVYTKKGTEVNKLTQESVLKTFFLNVKQGTDPANIKQVGFYQRPAKAVEAETIFGVQNVFQITGGSESKFGITEKMKIPQPAELADLELIQNLRKGSEPVKTEPKKK